MRQLCAYDANDANESTRRLVEDGMSTVLTNTHTAPGFSVLYHVFVRRQCILSSALPHKSYPWSLRDSFCHGTFAHSFIMTIGHLHDGVILLLWPGSFGVLLSCANFCFCYLNLTDAIVQMAHYKFSLGSMLPNPHTSFYAHPKGINIALSTLLRVLTLLYQHC